MYRNQTFHEAELIVQGQQEIVRALAALWTRLLTRLGGKAARTSRS